MLGCIQPMSSPMMKRILGFCPCCAEAGTLAIVMVIHITTRAPQIVLNLLMVALSSMSAAEARAAAVAHIHPPCLGLLPIQDRAPGAFGRTLGGWQIRRSALDALCTFGGLRLSLRPLLQGS